jgi:hypothetical protein
VGLATLLLTASPACQRSSGADRGTAANTVATEPPATATTATTNPYAVPAVIDVAYVNRVLAGLDGITGDVVRLIVKTKTIPREAYDRLRAIYATDDWLQLQIDSFQDDMRNGLVNYKPDPGNALTAVTQMITIQPTCIFARVRRDYSAVGVNSTTSDTQWIALRPLSASRDPQRYNLTSWALAYEGYTQTRNQPSDPCAS